MSGSPGTGGSNPRKFSEKIALHNQKQAEETRAFEQLMTDLNVSRVNTLQSAGSFPGTFFMSWNEENSRGLRNQTSQSRGTQRSVCKKPVDATFPRCSAEV